MRPEALPDGTVVRLARRTFITDAGSVLVGGSPTRVVRLSPRARAAFSRLLDRRRRLVVRDADSRTLAARLVETGLGEPDAKTLPARPLTDLTVVVPVRDRPRELGRLLESIPGGVAGIIVVDDASRDPRAVAAVARAHGATLVALDRNEGSAAARNAGLAHVATPFVAFVDSDAVVMPGCFEILLRHFVDPELALAAPRIEGLPVERPNAITRYEEARSSLDLGPDGASVRPWSPVAWVSSTCLVGRVDRLGDAFDPAMRVGEDVDIVWRLVAEGHRVRFEPAATVQHEHRTRWSRWLARKFFYGTGADPLARRHPRDIAPIVLAPWAAVMLGALAAQRRWSVPVAALTVAVTAVRIARRLPQVERPGALAVRLTAQGAAAALMQGSALLVRHAWPAAAAASLVSRRARRAVAVAAVADAVVEYLRLRPRLDPVRFAVARRLDDLAYGAGVWWGALRGRSLRALRPAIVRSSTQKRSARPDRPG